jgi:hypothetical protein
MSVTSFPIYGVVKVLLRYMPNFLLRRYYNAERLANLVYCDLLPRSDSAQLDLGQVTSAQVFLQVINLSPLPIELDRAQLLMHYGGASIDFFYLSPRIPVESGVVAFVPLRSSIHERSAQVIGQSRNAPQKAWLTGSLSFNCAVMNFEKSISLSEIRLHLVNVK